MLSHQSWKDVVSHQSWKDADGAVLHITRFQGKGEAVLLTNEFVLLNSDQIEEVIQHLKGEK